jgi:recombination protein RecT
MSKIEEMKKQVMQQPQTQVVKTEEKKPNLLTQFTQTTLNQFGKDWNEKERKYASNLVQYLYTKAKDNQTLMAAIVADNAGFLTCISKAITLNLPIVANDMFYLIPYSNTVTFQMSYQGYLELAWRAGLKQICVQEVYECDDFICEYGTNPRLVHIPNFKVRSSNKKIIYFYASVKSEYSEPIFEIMSYEEIQSHASKYSKSFTSNSSPWKSDFNAMARKTVLKRALKYLPKTEDLSKYLVHESEIEQDLNVAEKKYEEKMVIEEALS